ncbi:hypothetical protein JI666_13715 [Bacillus sp. NTK071]|uniref:hypothetical protein n=1 Tax=Bacillus sp. NTK071 TaxID=2802175 RepID=UPI001A8E7BEF|nr:hypothetical protein [Bacillus sp. NTK071]MBN8209809.1 hypothetical protein [Bacillus sp. NTK071]
MKINLTKREVHPASGAIMMAIGIFLYADVEAFPLIDQNVGWMFIIALYLISIRLLTSLFLQFSRNEFIEKALRHPVRFFAMGTWIAGIFVLCQVTLKYFPEWLHVIQVAAGLNTSLYVVFLFGCIIQMRALLKNQAAFSPHGIILLSTVATQSLVITWAKIYTIPVKFLLIGVIIGALFYLCSVWLINGRYLNGENWSLKDDWPNTNCILHGALSITGLALVSTQALSGTGLLLVWLAVLLVLLSVETVEIVRAVKRVLAYGWKKGLFTYDVSQWSRNFTFGMFYAFSVAMPEPHSLTILHQFHTGFLLIWSWVVLLFLCVEIFLWASSASYSVREKEVTNLRR